ncbi:NAD(P)H-dependent oxidoreductase [Roseivirga sp.]|uniref:NAD(P)H-dependent oxidoreductase n=1 Tax=Roseivirga sp. TaxID=1964215 RepID=UPI003B5235B8
MTYIDHLNWRYATKIFDAERKVSTEDLNYLMEAIRLSVSSYGLQLYKVLVIKNEEVRNALKTASWNQSQITDASHLFVFCNYTRNYELHVDEYLKRIVEIQENDSEELRSYGDSIKTQINQKTAEERAAWSQRQTYLALGNLLSACAELRIDACPMEGFIPSEYNRILGLNEMGLNAAVIAPVGYRSPNDVTQFRKKVRKSKETLFQEIE